MTSIASEPLPRRYTPRFCSAPAPELAASTTASTERARHPPVRRPPCPSEPPSAAPTPGPNLSPFKLPSHQ